MKKSILSIVVLAIALITSIETSAQKFPKLNKSPMDVASYPDNWRNSNKIIKVTYSRPQLKGRGLEKLAPLGKKWRVGANEATEITFYKDVNFGGKDIKAGTYTMYAIPGEKEWTIALSNQLNVWGAYFHKDENDIARITANVSKLEESVEAFSIVFDGEGEDAKMHMGWGNTLVSVPVKFDVSGEE